MKTKDLVINAIARKAEEINHKRGIYVRVFAKKIDTIRLSANKEKNVEGLMKIKKDLKLNDLFYILAMILGNGYVKNVDLGEVDFF